MKKFDNFCLSLSSLKEIYSYEEPYENVILTGVVGLYEICFEQSWKAMKEVLTQYGVAESYTGSPRQVLKAAYQAGMIKNEDVWLKALAARNNVAHAYNRAVALDIAAQTKEIYYKMFCDLKEEIEKNWSGEREDI